MGIVSYAIESASNAEMAAVGYVGVNAVLLECRPLRHRCDNPHRRIYLEIRLDEKKIRLQWASGVWD